jgi:hypothetical protein
MPAPFYREGEAEWADQQRAKYREQLASSKKELESMQEEFHKRAGPVSAGFALQSTATGNNYLFDTTSCADGKLHYSIVNADGEWQFFTDGSSPNPEGSLSGKNQGNWFAHLTAPQHISLGEHARGTGMPGGGGHEGHFAELLLSPLNQQTRIRLPRRTRTTGCCHIFRSAGWMPSRYATVF